MSDRRDSDQRYEQSDKGRDRMADYNQSGAGRKRKRRWKRKQAKPDQPPR